MRARAGLVRFVSLTLLGVAGSAALLAWFAPQLHAPPHQRRSVQSAAFPPASRWQVRDAHGRTWDLANLPSNAVIDGADLRRIDWHELPGLRREWPSATFVRCDFRGADLSSVDLSCHEFHHCDFRGANLSTLLGEEDWETNDIRSAYLQGALCGIDTRWPRGFDAHSHGVRIRYVGGDLRGKDLRHRNLAGADLSETVLAGADLRGANLTNACLYHTNLWRAKLRGTNLRGATYNHWTTWPDGFNPIAHGARPAQGAWW